MPAGVRDRLLGEPVDGGAHRAGHVLDVSADRHRDRRAVPVRPVCERGHVGDAGSGARSSAASPAWAVRTAGPRLVADRGWSAGASRSPGQPGSPVRSVRTMVRMSASVREASSAIRRRASVAASGLVAAVASPAWAHTAIAETWWATVSCRSRASRSRSSSFTWSSSRARALARNRNAAPSARSATSTAVAPAMSAGGAWLVASVTTVAAATIGMPSFRSRGVPQRASA